MEFFDIVDEKGIPTGETIERTQAHEKGVRHRTAHIWIVREQDGKAQLLLQKRSAEKDSFLGGSIPLLPDIFRRETNRKSPQSGNFTKNWESGRKRRILHSPDALIFNTKRNFMEKCFGTTRLHSSICTLSR